MNYAPARHVDKSVHEVCQRVNQLISINAHTKREQRRIRDIMDGGSQGIRALVGHRASRDMDTLDSLPAGNPILSGLTHLSQKLQAVPDLKITPPKDTQAAREHAFTREKIVRGLDDAIRLRMQLPQVGLWLPGYGYSTWVVVERRDPDGHPYPHAELRDPMETHPGDWGVDQRPSDVAFTRNIAARDLLRMYPQHAGALLRDRRGPNGSVLLGPSTPIGNGSGSNYQTGDVSGWSSQTQGIQIVEYYDEHGCWWVVPDRNLLLEFKPLPAGMTRPQFVIGKRFAFNRLQGQYDHVIGLMALHARLTVMNAQFIQDNVNTEALALDTPIPTPTGWTTMGEITEGDMILGADGLPVEVIKATEVQDDRATYRVTFEDGTSVVASDGHLWQTKKIGSRMEPKVRTTQEMVDEGRKFRVPAAQPWKLPEADLPIDPYVLGLWLGDGSSNNAIVSSSWDDVEETRANIERAGFETKIVAPQPGRCAMVYISSATSGKGFHGSGLHGALRACGLLNNKHVPAEYLRASIDQRLALVRGLMDSDGNVNKSHQCRFGNTNGRIADAMVGLLRSLGEVPFKRWVEDDRNRGGGIWEVTFTPRQFVPFLLARKVERVRFHRRGPEWVTIKSIEPVDTVPVRCIAVASDDHLFLAGEGGHVTHNTNIYGQAPPGGYRKGRFAINEFDPNTRVEKPVNVMQPQVFQAINNIERQLRITARYPVTDDGQSPNSFVTGAGLEELGSTMSLEVREYQTVLSNSIEELDCLRLEWLDRAYGDVKRPLYGEYKGERYAETYTPKVAIAGNYQTRRKYGFMAGWDEARKLVSGINLVQNEIIPRQVMRENLDGLDESLTRVEELIRAEKAESVAMSTLLQLASQGDPNAMAAAIDMMPSSPVKSALERFFTPQEQPEQPGLPQGPAQPPGLEDMLAQMQGGESLSRLTADGNVGGGIQSRASAA